MPRSFGIWPIGCLTLCLLFPACDTVATKTYQVRQRAFTYKPSALIQDYQEEYAYIEQRRLSVVRAEGATPPDLFPVVTKVPPHLTGLAFSGGGIRSATFHLGVLQALQDMGSLQKIDYLSTVSGGSYVAGWMLAHLSQELDDAYGNLVQTPDQPHSWTLTAISSLISGIMPASSEKAVSGKGRSSSGAISGGWSPIMSGIWSCTLTPPGYRQ